MRTSNQRAKQSSAKRSKSLGNRKSLGSRKSLPSEEEMEEDLKLLKTIVVNKESIPTIESKLKITVAKRQK